MIPSMKEKNPSLIRFTPGNNQHIPKRETEPMSCYKTGPEVLMGGNLAYKGVSSWSNNPSVIRINVHQPVNTLIITWRQQNNPFDEILG